jgi:hypothetical protein
LVSCTRSSGKDEENDMNENGENLSEEKIDTSKYVFMVEGSYTPES